jgi:hypothetical protein
VICPPSTPRLPNGQGRDSSAATALSNLTSLPSTFVSRSQRSTNGPAAVAARPSTSSGDIAGTCRPMSEHGSRATDAMMTDPYESTFTIHLVLHRMRPHATSRKRVPTCRVSLLTPHGRRTFWWYVAVCPVCSQSHLGRARDLRSVTVTRQLPCKHRVAIVIAQTDGDPA